MPSLSQKLIEKINPATGQLIRTYEVADADAVRQAVAQTRSALPGWRALSLLARSRVLRTAMQLLFEQSDSVARLISEETGKPLADALEGDIGTALSVLSYYADLGPRRLKPRAISPDLISVITGRAHWETYHPRGVIGVISPWNYPLAIPASGLVTALMAGNTVVLKPSELTPATGERLVSILHQALQRHQLSTDAVQLVIGDGSTGAALVEADIDGVIFTGSDRTGRAIRASMTERGLWSSLELGGSDAMIVLDGCNLEKSASYAVWGRYTNAGQACASVKRLLVPEKHLDELLRHLQNKIASLRVGPPDNPEHHVGPLISETQLNMLESQVQDALAKGAKLLSGGKRLPGGGWFFEPTLLSQVPSSARILSEEVFGPVLPVISYKTLDEAIQVVNASAFGLTASVFGPVAQARWVAERLECGTVVINDVGPSNYAMPCAPWGGWKRSGSGASHGERALLELTRLQVVSINRLFEIPGLHKPLWHFGRQGRELASRSRAVLAFSARHPSMWNPKTWLAFWQHRASTKI
jgi:acyl-CoA reductase-like NAD-dependent aldehyde dehydrogenase